MMNVCISQERFRTESNVNPSCMYIGSIIRDLDVIQQGIRIVFEPEVYAIHGPVMGDVTAKAYKNALDKSLFKNMKRKGLS